MYKKLLCVLLCLSIGYIAWTKSYIYNIDKAVSHVETSALSKSHTCCAWFVMRAMNAGGCPIGILPAFAYKEVLPKYGFVEIDKNSSYRKGDIVVFPAIKNHIYGHIAMWTGKQWISDFKQKSIFPAKGYRYSDYRIFRYKGI
jgi:hypothetical protein